VACFDKRPFCINNFEHSNFDNYKTAIIKTEAWLFYQRMGAEPRTKLEAARPKAIESALLVIPIMASVVNQAVTLPTAALAMEAGPLGGKKERTEGI
jgi:hypothetical protein